MNQEEIQKLININKKITEEGVAKPSQSKPIQSNQQYPIYGTSTGADISHLDDCVFGNYVPTNNENEQQTWDAKEAYNKMKNIEKAPRENIKNSKIPSAILESVLSNPLYGLEVEDDVDNFIYNKGIAKENVDAINEISRRLDEATKKPLNETIEKTTIPSNIDETIRRILDEKFEELTYKLLANNRTINESKNVEAASIKGFKITPDGRFFFLANNDDLYECQMKYIGKNKKRKKSTTHSLKTCGLEKAQVD